MLPAEIACRNCAAQPGEPCVDLMSVPPPYFHAERVQDAASIGVEGANVSKEAFAKALDQMGLV